MKPAAFEYHAPTTADEAVHLLAELGDEAKVLAGGQSLIPMLALRLTAFEHLIDIGHIASIKSVERRDGALRIGAATTETAVERSPDVATLSPLLARATPLIGHFQIRNRGTVGGSIAHADPAAEYPAVALALDAEMEVTSTRGTRTIASSDFFTGLWSTTLDPDELLVAVSLPVWQGRCGFAVEEFARRHGDFAIAGAAVAVQLDPDDRVARCAIGLIGLGSTPVRALDAERQLIGTTLGVEDAEVAGRAAVASATDVMSDLHAPSDYRRRVGTVMVKRALLAAATEAQHA